MIHKENGLVESKQDKIAGVTLPLLARSVTQPGHSPGGEWAVLPWAGGFSFLSFELLICEMLQTRHQPCLSCKACVSMHLVKCLPLGRKPTKQGWGKKSPTVMPFYLTP